MFTTEADHRLGHIATAAVARSTHASSQGHHQRQDLSASANSHVDPSPTARITKHQGPAPPDGHDPEALATYIVDAFARAEEEPAHGGGCLLPADMPASSRRIVFNFAEAVTTAVLEAVKEQLHFLQATTHECEPRSSTQHGASLPQWPAGSADASTRSDAAFADSLGASASQTRHPGSHAGPPRLLIPRFADEGDSVNVNRENPQAAISTPALAAKQAAIATAMRRKSLRSLGLPTPTGAAAVPPTPTRVTESAAISLPDPTDGSYSINGYVVLDTIGHGAQGEVFMAFDSASGELRAVKSVPKPPAAVALALAQSTDKPDGGAAAATTQRALPTSTRAGSLPFALARDRQRRQRLAREVAIMKRCRHPNIVRLYEVIDDPSHDRMYLVMQHVEHGSIVSLRPDGTVDPAAGPGLAAAMSGARFPAMPSLGGPINPVELVHYAEQIVSGLQYLHRRGILHRDLKPDNILLGAHDTVYLSDFGLSTLMADEEAPDRGAAFAAGGTAAFMAPEAHDPALRGADGSLTTAVDVWALGVTLYALLYGKLPFPSVGTTRHLPTIIDEILTRDIEFPPQQPSATGLGDFPLPPAAEQSKKGLPTAPTLDSLDDDNDTASHARSPGLAATVEPSDLDPTGHSNQVGRHCPRTPPAASDGHSHRRPADHIQSCSVHESPLPPVPSQDSPSEAPFLTHTAPSSCLAPLRPAIELPCPETSTVPPLAGPCDSLAEEGGSDEPATTHHDPPLPPSAGVLPLTSFQRTRPRGRGASTVHDDGDAFGVQKRGSSNPADARMQLASSWAGFVRRLLVRSVAERPTADDAAVYLQRLRRHADSVVELADGADDAKANVAF